MLRHGADKKHREEIATQAVEGECSCCVAGGGRPSLGIRHRERVPRIGWWFDNLFIARRWAIRERMLLSRLRRDCSDTRSASSQCSNERGPLAPLHGAPLNAALT